MAPEATQTASEPNTWKPHPQLKEKIDVYKIRIEEFDRNYYSLRDLEWRISLQSLSGYIAVGIAYHAITRDSPDQVVSRWCAGVVIALSALYAVFRFLLHQRLRYARDTKNEYVKQMHELAGIDRANTEVNYKLWGKNWYALVMQLLVHILAVVAVVAFVTYEKPKTPPVPAQAVGGQKMNVQGAAGGPEDALGGAEKGVQLPKADHVQGGKGEPLDKLGKNR